MTFRQLRSLCLSLPQVEERETWGEATFRVRDKIFAMGSPEGDSVSIKASLDDQSGLIAIDPDTFTVSAYTGRYGWVTVRLRTVGPDLMTRLVVAAWKRTAARRAVSLYEATTSSTDFERLAPNTRLGSAVSAPLASRGRIRLRGR